MHHMRRSRLRSNRLALNDGDPSAAPPAPHVPALPLGTLTDSVAGASYHSSGPSRPGSPPDQTPPTFPVAWDSDGPASHAYESLGHAQPKGTSGGASAIGEAAQHAAQRVNSSSTVASGHLADSPTALVMSPPGALTAPSHTCTHNVLLQRNQLLGSYTHAALHL